MDGLSIKTLNLDRHMINFWMKLSIIYPNAAVICADGDDGFEIKILYKEIDELDNKYHTPRECDY